MFRISQPTDADGMKLPCPWYVASQGPFHFLVYDENNRLQNLERDPATGDIFVESIGGMPQIQLQNYTPHAALRAREMLMLRATRPAEPGR